MYQVVEVDLDRLDGAVTWSDGALVVGRRDGLPVAAALIDGAPPASTSAIADRLTRRFGRPLPGPGAPVTVTVAVCARDRPERLARCLVSVAAAMEEAGVEVSAQMLVVDNASADGRTSDAGRAAGARVVVEPVAGLDGRGTAPCRNARPRCSPSSTTTSSSTGSGCKRSPGRSLHIQTRGPSWEACLRTRSTRAHNWSSSAVVASFSAGKRGDWTTTPGAIIRSMLPSAWAATWPSVSRRSNEPAPSTRRWTRRACQAVAIWTSSPASHCRRPSTTNRQRWCSTSTDAPERSSVASTARGDRRGQRR